MTIKFRPYQKRIIDAQGQFLADPEVFRATVLAATGAGKTETFIDMILEVFKQNPNSRILIAHPRIALSQDQQKRLFNRLQGYLVEFTSFHSGHQKYHTLSDRKNLSTTNRDQLLEIQENSPGHHITFSSYKSLHKIADMDFDVIICDEAHYLVQSDLRECLHLFESKTVFFTGTPIRVAAAEESMDNTELFGDIIAEVPPSELIPLGYIVPPRLRTINVKNKKVGNTFDYSSIIAHAFHDQKQLAHQKFNHKMLVAMPRTGEFDNIMQDLAKIRKECGQTNLDLYYITADCAVKNGINLKDRETALTDFDLNQNPCVIIHCDTLAEGIDVDGLGGVLIMRGLGMVKAIQTMGRGCRAAKQDIKKDGNIRKHRVKTECIVTIARIDNQWAGDVNIREWAEMFKAAGYGDIWDFYEPEADNRSAHTEMGETDDPLFDVIEDIRIVDGAEATWRELFEGDI